MNNRRSASEQLIFNFLLSFLAVWFIFNHFNAPKQANVAARQAPTLQEAFQGVRLSGDPANAEIAKLQKNIEANPQDELAQWSRLRIGLIQQYGLGQLAPVMIPGSFFSKSWQGTIYDEIVQQHGSKPVDIQALYQSGDYQWRRGKANGTITHEAIYPFETLLQRTRSDKSLNDLQIFVQTANSSDKNPVFEQKTVAQTLGSTGTTDPNAVLVRVDEFYHDKSLYRSVDTVVRFFGHHPATSYGFTIIALAMLTRILMQPLTKKQYESMKGMTVIAPEMKKIQEKYKGKTDQQAQMVKEIQELQRRHGVSPMLGCGLGLLQIPFFFYIVSPAMRQYEAKMELVGASFLWIQNLARPDIPLLVLYGITMFVSFRLSSLPPTDETQRQQQRIMMFMMPVFPFFLLTYPSAFAFYWMIFNLTSTILQYRMMKQSDPDKRFIKSLMGMPAPIAAAEEPVSVVPPRPKSGAKKPKPAALEAPLEAAIENPAETRNGTHKSDKKEKLQVKATSDVVQENGAAKNSDKSGSSQRKSKRRH